MTQARTRMSVRLINATLRQVYRAGYWLLWAQALLTRPHGRGVKGLVTNGGALLFVRHTYGPREWELPGGGQRRHESPPQAISRELREELGLEVTDPVALGTFNGPHQYANNVVTYFSVALSSRAVRPDPIEIAEVRWCDPADPPRPLGWYAREALRRNGAAGATM
jgi:8-oxo-dGTP pyrophosphatase MutT (NUDIX family)